jgi:hypothetical protein
MHIFVDESGNFAPVAATRHSVSVVGALVIPDNKIDQLFARYARLRKRLPKSPNGEVKGKLLNEEDVAAVCDLLRRNSCLFEAVGMDLGYESLEGMEQHRHIQAEAITRHLTDQHQPGMIEGVWEWRRSLEATPLPLYAQSTVIFEVLAAVIKHAPLYYVQRSPKELANFHWVIDGKEVGKVTNVEKWWSETMLPMLQSRSRTEPMPALVGANYTYFDEKFISETPDFLRPFGFKDETGVDLRRLLKESFRFSSEAEPGLELVDVVTNATRRALRGNLRVEGWQHIPPLMVHRKGQYLHLVCLTLPERERRRPPYSRVVTVGFARGGRSMLTRSYLSDVE